MYIPETVELTSIEITTEPLEYKEQELNQLPQEVQNKMYELNQLAHKKPQEAIEYINDILTHHRKHPVLLNYLTAAYSRAGKKRESEETSKENFQLFTNYLFAKINYAQICLDNEHPEKVPAIFDYKLDLKSLYPNRSKFHVNEVIAFLHIMAIYHYQIREKNQAKRYYSMMKKLDKKHILTRNARKVIQPSILRIILQKLDKKLENKLES
jgi:hypothetical protein